MRRKLAHQVNTDAQLCFRPSTLKSTGTNVPIAPMESAPVIQAHVLFIMPNNFTFDISSRSKVKVMDDRECRDGS